MTFEQALEQLKQTNPLRITVSGDLGAGKSTFAKRLATALDIPRTYAGALLREKAAEQGIDINELGTLMESEEELDRWVDSVTTQRAREMERGIFEGRTAWHFVEEPTATLFLSVDADVASERIWGDKENALRANYQSLEEVKEKNDERKKSEIKRYHNYYGIDVYDQKHYDIVVDTTHLNRDEVFEQTVIQIAEFLQKSANA